METGEPLFPGDNDVDQLWLILKCTGALTPSHTATLHGNPYFAVSLVPCTIMRSADVIMSPSHCLQGKGPAFLCGHVRLQGGSIVCMQGMRQPSAWEVLPLEKRFRHLDLTLLQFLKVGHRGSRKVSM